MSAQRRTASETEELTKIRNAEVDARMRPVAFALYVYIKSRPPKWDYSEQRIADHFRIGRDAIRTGLKELEQAGILIRKKRHNGDKTQKRGFDYILNQP